MISARNCSGGTEQRFDLAHSHKTDPAKSAAEKIQIALASTLPKNLQALLNYESLLSKGFHRALHTLQAMQQRRLDVIDGEATQVLADNVSETPQETR